MENLIKNFTTEIIPEFDLNAVCQSSTKRQPVASNESKYAERDEPTLSVLGSGNTIVRDCTTNGYVNLALILKKLYTNDY